MSNHEEEDFAALFEASTKKQKGLTRGQTIEGRIVRIGPEVALVDVGGGGRGHGVRARHSELGSRRAQGGLAGTPVATIRP